MIPTLTPVGRLALAAACLLFVCGALGGAAPILALGEVAVLGILVAYVATLAVPRLIRREKIEFAWWLAHAEGGVLTPGATFRVRAYVRNRCARSFGASRLGVFASEGLRVEGHDRLAVLLPRGCRTDLDL